MARQAFLPPTNFDSGQQLPTQQNNRKKIPISTNIRGNTTMHQVFPPSYTDATGHQTRKLPVNTAQHFLNSAHASTQQGSTLKQHQPYIETTFYKRTPENSSIANPQLIQPQILGSKSAIFKQAFDPVEINHCSPFEKTKPRQHGNRSQSDKSRNRFQTNNQI